MFNSEGGGAYSRLAAQADMHVTSLQGLANLCIVHEYMLINSVNLYTFFSQNPSTLVAKLLVVIMYWVNRIKGRAAGDQGNVNKILVAITDIMRYIAMCFRANPIIAETIQNVANMSNIMRVLDAAEIFQPLKIESLRCLRLIVADYNHCKVVGQYFGTLLPVMVEELESL